VIAIALAVAAATALGFGAEHRLGARSENLARALIRLMLWVVLPPVVFVNIARLDPSANVAAGVAFGFASLFVGLAVAYLVGTRVLRLAPPSVGGLMLVAGFANTGYLGLPVVIAVFGAGELPSAIVYDLAVTTLAIFTIGATIAAAFGTAASRPRERLRLFLTRNPALFALLAGLLAPAALAPDWALELSHDAVYVLLPIGFFVVGLILAAEAEEGAIRFPPRLTAPVGVALAIKLLLVPGVVVALSALVLEVPEAFPVQAAMASAVNSLTIGHEYGLDRRLIASTIAWSTAIVLAAGLASALV